MQRSDDADLFARSAAEAISRTAHERTRMMTKVPPEGRTEGRTRGPEGRTHATLSSPRRQGYKKAWDMRVPHTKTGCLFEIFILTLGRRRPRPQTLPPSSSILRLRPGGSRPPWSRATHAGP